MKEYCFNLLKHYSNLSWQEVEDLASDGEIGPHNDLESALLLAEKKPAWLTCKPTGEKFVSIFNNFTFSLVPALEFRLKEEGKDWIYTGVVYRDKKCFDQICFAFELYFQGNQKDLTIDTESLSLDILLGLGLGYNKNDICKWIAINIGKDNFSIWKNSFKIVTCVEDGDYSDLSIGEKYYQKTNPFKPDKYDMIRIVDDSGEDYLYPKRLFINENL